MKILQTNLTKLRKDSKLTQRELSERLGVASQTVSKWENGNSLPDITLLPIIAETFKVSVDQLLGVIPIEYGNYNKREKDSAKYRNQVLEQFKATRQLFWNDDYLSFFIRNVLEITESVNIAEISCGNGSFAKQLLPLLPIGSTYTGYEKSDVMRDDGHILFQNNDSISILPFSESENSIDFYDIVICQGYLRQLSDPVAGINLMKKMTKPGGLIIGHEENRPFENAGLLLGNESDDSFEKSIFLDKIWHQEFLNEGRDYRIGLRLPLLLKKAGLTNIQCRMNDHVDLLLGDKESEETLRLLNDHYKITSIDENHFLSFLMERGLSRYEAFRYIELYNKRKSFMTKNYKEIELVHVMGLMLSWGWKK